MTSKTAALARGELVVSKGACLQIPRTSVRDYLLLAGLTLAAIAVQGYHPGVEDAEIYAPGILKALRPSLFPYNSQFFQAHASMTIFPNLIAGSIRLTHLPPWRAFFARRIVTAFLLLWACLRIARLCFALDPRYMALPGEDQHGFRVIAQRSALADAVKDSGAATMFPGAGLALDRSAQCAKRLGNIQPRGLSSP